MEKQGIYNTQIDSSLLLNGVMPNRCKETTELTQHHNLPQQK